MKTELLQVERVSKRYTGHTALDNISMSVAPGSIHGLLGPNGAGKTTLIRIINRITAPDGGRIQFQGKALSDQHLNQIGYLPEERGLYPQMKAGEQALFFAQLKGLSRREATQRLKEWFDRFEIGSWWDKKVVELSKGMAQKLQFIITVLHEPQLLIFDEPFSGFDPINARMVQQEILRLKQQGTTIILSTHDMASVEELCDSITLLNESHNILNGNVNEIRHRYGEHLFNLDFVGDEQQLTQALEGLCEVSKTGSASGNRVQLHLHSSEDIRAVLSQVNNCVEVHTFAEVIPSMRDIFIKAVEGKL